MTAKTTRKKHGTRVDAIGGTQADPQKEPTCPPTDDGEPRTHKKQARKNSPRHRCHSACHHKMGQAMHQQALHNFTDKTSTACTCMQTQRLGHGEAGLAHPSYWRAPPFPFSPTVYRLLQGEPLASPRGYTGTPLVPLGEFIQIPSSVPSWPATLLRGMLVWHHACHVVTATPHLRRTVVIETPHAFRRLTSTFMRHAYDVCGRWFMR